MNVSGLPRRVLAHVVDESLVEDCAGKVTQRIVAAVDAPTSRVGHALHQLARRGLVTWDHNAISGRTFRVWATQEGRAALHRGVHVRSVIGRRVPPPSVAVMPQAGPLVTVPFDPDAARERALGGVS